ncbi:hypothetical protein LIER_02310 [Lithospermum erythrorhizon]|uniref:Uncharacterized protein n=1 Tax=Lithospermum erythrorhizon TaxID=34254 RepID=A0AAV3NP21_LITER
MTDERVPLFWRAKVFIARKRMHSDILDLTEDPHSSNFLGKEPLDDSTRLNPSTSDSLPDEGSDSAPRAKTGYSANYLDLPYTLPGGFQVTESSTLWKKSDAFRASRPLLLERIGKVTNPFTIPWRFMVLLLAL